MRRCVLGKNAMRVFFIGSRAVFLMLLPSWTKDLQTKLKKLCLISVGDIRRSLLGSFAQANKFLYQKYMKQQKTLSTNGHYK